MIVPGTRKAPPSTFDRECLHPLQGPPHRRRAGRAPASLAHPIRVCPPGVATRATPTQAHLVALVDPRETAATAFRCREPHVLDAQSGAAVGLPPRALRAPVSPHRVCGDHLPFVAGPASPLKFSIASRVTGGEAISTAIPGEPPHACEVARAHSPTVRTPDAALQLVPPTLEAVPDGALVVQWNQAVRYALRQAPASPMLGDRTELGEESFLPAARAPDTFLDTLHRCGPTVASFAADEQRPVEVDESRREDPAPLRADDLGEPVRHDRLSMGVKSCTARLRTDRAPPTHDDAARDRLPLVPRRAPVAELGPVVPVGRREHGSASPGDDSQETFCCRSSVCRCDPGPGARVTP